MLTCIPQKQGNGPVVRCMVTIKTEHNKKIRLRITYANEVDKWCNQLIKFNNKDKKVSPTKSVINLEDECNKEEDNTDLMEQAQELCRLTSFLIKWRKEKAKRAPIVKGGFTKKISDDKVIGIKTPKDPVISLVTKGDGTGITCSPTLAHALIDSKTSPFHKVDSQAYVDEEHIDTNSLLPLSHHHSNLSPSQNGLCSDRQSCIDRESNGKISFFDESQKCNMWMDGELGSEIMREKGNCDITQLVTVPGGGPTSSESDVTNRSDPTIPKDVTSAFPSFPRIQKDLSNSISIKTSKTMDKMSQQNISHEVKTLEVSQFSSECGKEKYSEVPLRTSEVMSSNVLKNVPMYAEQENPVVHFSHMTNSQKFKLYPNTSSAPSAENFGTDHPNQASFPKMLEAAGGKIPPPVLPKPKIKVIRQLPKPHTVMSEHIHCTWCRKNTGSGIGRYRPLPFGAYCSEKNSYNQTTTHQSSVLIS